MFAVTAGGGSAKQERSQDRFCWLEGVIVIQRSIKRGGFVKRSDVKEIAKLLAEIDKCAHIGGAVDDVLVFTARIRAILLGA